MFVHTYMLSVDEEDLERSENTREQVPEYWTPFSFHIDNIEDYYEHLEDSRMLFQAN